METAPQHLLHKRARQRLSQALDADSTRTLVKDRAALHANIALHPPQPSGLRSTLKQQWLWLCPGLVSSAHKISAVSGLHLSPTSAANTTSRARPPSPESSGLVRSFRCLASSSPAPSWLAALLLAVPSQWGHQGRVDGQLSTVPQCQTVRQSTSSLRLSRALKAARSTSLTRTLVATRAPGSQQT